MKKKGFTLIELLAVIVILAIIALIAVPMVLNIIEKSKVGALKSSLTGLIESADMYYANRALQGGTAVETVFDFEDGEQISGETLEYKGKIENGKLILHANGEVAACIDDGTHYAYRNKDDNEVTTGTGICLYDGTTGDFSSNSSLEELQKQLASVTATAEDVLKGKTILTSSGIVTGTLVNEYTIEDMQSLVTSGTLVSSTSFSTQSNQTAYVLNNTSSDTNAKFVVYVQWKSGGGWGNRISLDYYGYTFARLSNGLNSAEGKAYFGILPYETGYTFVVGQNTGSGTIYLYQVQ